MKTTKEDFKFFKGECNKWIKKLQIDDGEVHLWHENPTKSNADATISKDTIHRRADVSI